MSDKEAQIGKEVNEKLDHCCKDDTVLGRKTTFNSRASISAPAHPVGLDGSPGTAKGDFPSLDLKSASSWSDDMHGLGSLDPQRSIILRFECMSAAELKVRALP